MGITFDKSKLKTVSINEVRPNTWNPKNKDTKELEKVKHSIKENGQLLPIFVRDNNGYEIIDGEQRYLGCLEADFKDVLIYDFGQVEDLKAKALTIWFQQQVPFNRVEEAYLAMEIIEGGLELPYTTEEIGEMKDISEFDFDQYQEHDLDDSEFKTLSLHFKPEQYEVVIDAINEVGETNERSIELICADYLGK